MAVSWRAIQRIKDDLRDGAVLLQLGNAQRRGWFTVPGGEVHRTVAEAVIREIDIIQTADARWPNHVVYAIDRGRT